MRKLDDTAMGSCPVIDLSHIVPIVCGYAGEHRGGAQVLPEQLRHGVRPLQLRPRRVQGQDRPALHTQPHG